MGSWGASDSFSRGHGGSAAGRRASGGMARIQIMTCILGPGGVYQRPEVGVKLRKVPQIMHSGPPKRAFGRRDPGRLARASAGAPGPATAASAGRRRPSTRFVRPVPSGLIVQMPAETPGSWAPTRPKTMTVPSGENDGDASLNSGSSVRSAAEPSAWVEKARWSRAVGGLNDEVEGPAVDRAVDLRPPARRLVTTPAGVTRQQDQVDAVVGRGRQVERAVGLDPRPGASCPAGPGSWAAWRRSDRPAAATLSAPRTSSMVGAVLPERRARRPGRPSGSRSGRRRSRCPGPGRPSGATCADPCR